MSGAAAVYNQVGRLVRSSPCGGLFFVLSQCRDTVVVRAFGVLVYELASGGKTPYERLTLEQVARAIRQREGLLSGSLAAFCD